MSVDGEKSWSEKLGGIKHIILVLSGKGGVGKSTVSVQIALALAAAGKKVGLLDTDLCGPSIPRMLKLESRDVHQCEDGWVPVYVDSQQNLCAMSIGFLLTDKTDAVVWRGPKKTAMIRQFLGDVVWGELDYLIVDTPPGTSDEHLTIVECLKDVSPEGAVLVTTPQGVSLADVRREASFCKQADIPILGMVENMSGFVCPCCNEQTDVFSKGGGENLAKELKVPFLGRIPLDPGLATSCDSEVRTEDVASKVAASGSFQAVQSIAAALLK